MARAYGVWNMRRCRRAAFVFVLFAFFGALEEARAGEPNGFSLEAGARGMYSSGISEPYYSYKIDTAAGFSAGFVSVLLGYVRHQHYQLTDGAGNYGYTDFDQAHAGIVFSPTRIFELTAGVRYSNGASSFRGVEYRGEASLYFGAVSITGEYMSAGEGYELDGLDLENKRRLYSLEASLGVSETVWIDAGLDHDGIDFETTGAAYTKTTGNFGLGINPARPITMLFGVNYGRDSFDYTLFGVDAGLDLRLPCGLKASIFYLGTYYEAPPSVSINSVGGHGGGGVYGRDANPFLRSSLIGKSFAAHTMSAGVSFVF